jgi:sugar phosphate isomerase/epimerase
MIRIGTLVYGSNAVSSIEQLLPYGFESYSLTFWQTLGDCNLSETAARLRDLLAPTEAIVSSLGVFGNPLVPEGEPTRQAWKQLIAAAPLFGCDLVGGFTGRLPGLPLEQSLPAYKKVFGELAQFAADHGVRLCFENCAMDGTWAAGDWNIAINPQAWQMMWETLDLPHLGLEWEPCHQRLALCDPLPGLRDWAHKVFHVHGKDASIDWAAIQRHGILGKVQFARQRTAGFGDSNWTEIFSILHAAGYTGCLDIEGFHDPVYRDDLELRGQVFALEYLRKCRP